MNRYDGTAFDFDGVLVESEPINVAAAEKTFRELGQPLSEEEMLYVPGRSSRRFIPEFLKRRGEASTTRIDEIVQRNIMNYDALWAIRVKLMPGVHKVCVTLSTLGVKLAIVTSNRRAVVERFKSRFGLSCFDVIVSSEDVTQHKPDPQCYSLAGARMGIPVQRILAVEDTSIGVQAAKLAGLACAAIPSAEASSRDDFRRADYTLHSLHELIPIVIRGEDK